MTISWAGLKDLCGNVLSATKPAAVEAPVSESKPGERRLRPGTKLYKVSIPEPPYFHQVIEARNPREARDVYLDWVMSAQEYDLSALRVFELDLDGFDLAKVDFFLTEKRASRGVR